MKTNTVKYQMAMRIRNLGAQLTWDGADEKKLLLDIEDQVRKYKSYLAAMETPDEEAK